MNREVINEEKELFKKAKDFVLVFVELQKNICVVMLRKNQCQQGCRLIGKTIKLLSEMAEPSRENVAILGHLEIDFCYLANFEMLSMNKSELTEVLENWTSSDIYKKVQADAKSLGINFDGAPKEIGYIA